MKWYEYQRILRYSKFDNATAGGSDTSVDASPKVDPNNFLAPMADATVGQAAVLILGYMLIAYIGLIAYKHFRP